MLVERVYRKMEELDDVPKDRTVYLVKRYEGSDDFPPGADLVVDIATFDEDVAERRTDELYDDRGPEISLSTITISP